jgi:hypothetical protein
MGTSKIGLSYDPAKAKGVFDCWAAMSEEYVYYEWEDTYFDQLAPNGTNAQHDNYKRRLTNLFKEKFVHGTRLTVGTMGTSVMASTDNCWYYHFAPTLQMTSTPPTTVSTT